MKHCPPEDEIDIYIKELGAYQRIYKGGVAFRLQISNDGTAKATDIRVFIDFPEEFLLFEISDIENIEPPKVPQLPQNPIKIAEEEYVKHMNLLVATIEELNRNWNQFNLSANLSTITAKIADSHFNTINWSLSVREHRIIVETHQIPHKDLSLFDGIYVVPTTKGKFRANVSLMCSEYLEPVMSYIDIEVV